MRTIHDVAMVDESLRAYYFLQQASTLLSPLPWERGISITGSGTAYKNNLRPALI